MVTVQWLVAASALAANTVSIESQFEIDLPDGWVAYDQNRAVLNRMDGQGVVIFASGLLFAEGAAVPSVEAIRQWDTGALPSFFVDRKPTKGPTCDKFSRTHAYNVGTELKKDPAFGVVGQLLGSARPVAHKPVSIGGCKGWHYQAAPGDWVLDVYAVSNAGVLYLFSLRNKTSHYESNRAAFESAVASVRFPATNPR